MSIRQKVIQHITETLSDRFQVVDNTGPEKKIIAGQFPDVLIFKKEPPNNTDPLFILKIENGEDLVDSVSQWKELGSDPSVFYIVLPEDKLDEAKKLVSATGVRAKFAWYKVHEKNVTRIHYG